MRLLELLQRRRRHRRKTAQPNALLTRSDLEAARADLTVLSAGRDATISGRSADDASYRVRPPTRDLNV
jgi:hypothetical protein